MARVPDWLVHSDGLMCNRYHTCTGCGGNIQGLKVFEGLYDAPTLTIGYVTCQRCRAADPRDRRIAQLLAKRYAPARLAQRDQGQP